MSATGTETSRASAMSDWRPGNWTTTRPSCTSRVAMRALSQGGCGRPAVRKADPGFLQAFCGQDGPMKVGLVLGAGGVVGAAWLIGALEALSAETGWDPSSADHIVGTSAGSVVGALVADGLAPEYLAAYSAGRTLDDFDDADDRAAALAERFGGRERLDDLAERLSGDDFKMQLALPSIGPGSLRMALRTAARPHRHNPSALLAGWLPRGFVSTAPI